MKKVILQGIDYEGDTRELEFSSVEAAEAFGKQMIKGEFSWKGFAVWRNHPETEEWSVETRTVM